MWGSGSINPAQNLVLSEEQLTSLELAAILPLEKTPSVYLE